MQHVMQIQMQMQQIATCETHFLLNGKFYDQLDSVAMGSLLAPVLANLFIGHNEKLLKPKTFRRLPHPTKEEIWMIFLPFSIIALKQKIFKLYQYKTP